MNTYFYINLVIYILAVSISVSMLGIVIYSITKGYTQNKRTPWILVGFLVVVQIGIGFPLYQNFQNKAFALNKNLVGKTFHNTSENTELDQLFFLDEDTLVVTTNQNTTEVDYRITGNDRFYLTQALNNQNHNGKIENHLEHLTITITRPTGVLEFVEAD